MGIENFNRWNPDEVPLDTIEGNEVFFGAPLAIHSIFVSLEGEGPDAGVPTVFLRVQGCNCSCAWCDTKQAQAIPDLSDKTEEDFKRINRLAREEIHKLLYVGQAHRVSFTGGNPMLYATALASLKGVLFDRYGEKLKFNIEHPGLGVDLEEDYHLGFLKGFDSISFDYKTISSEVVYDRFASMSAMLDFSEEVSERVQVTIKAVITCLDDLEECLDTWMSSLSHRVTVEEGSRTLLKTPTFILSPGSLSGGHRTLFPMLENCIQALHGHPVFRLIRGRLSVQQHSLLGFE